MVNRATGKRSLGSRFHPFSEQLSHCFRREGDKTKDTRKMATPSQDEIIQNLNDLLDDWKKELNEKGIYEIEKLRDLHSSCLADIAPHDGTNKNENIHGKLRGFFKNRRNLSLEKFHALLTVVLIDHNRSISKNAQPLITLPIVQFERQAIMPIEYEGQ
jgi:hypothetical protein